MRTLALVVALSVGLGLRVLAGDGGAGERPVTADGGTPSTDARRRIIWDDQTCVAARGCGARPLPRCPPLGKKARVQTWLNVSKRASKLLGRAIRVRGLLLPPSGGALTLKACGANDGKDRCCNGFGPVPMWISGAGVDLEVEGLHCQWDESGFCCNTDAHAREVIASGTLQLEKAPYSHPRWQLAGAKVCQIE